MEIDINKLLNLPELEVLSFSFTETRVDIKLKCVTESGICPKCQAQVSKVRSYPSRTVRDLSILGRKTYLTIVSRQFECESCSRYFVEELDLVEGNQGLTKRYELYLYGRIKGVTIQQISLQEDVCWATLNRIHKHYGTLELQNRAVEWSAVKRLSIDEISVKKGKKNFACVLRDGDTGVVLDFLEKRDMASLKTYFSKKGVIFCAQIEEVISDMWDGYVNLAGPLSIFPNAINVIDLFHFVQHLGKALDHERKAERKALPEEEALKSLRWPLLKAPEDLDEKEALCLVEAFKVSPKLGQIYALRQDLKDIFAKDCTKEVGINALNQWQEKAQEIASKHLDKFLVTLNNWKDKVANFFTNRVTNAAMEGTNNHIRTIIRAAYGFHNFDSLKLRVLTECGASP